MKFFSILFSCLLFIAFQSRANLLFSLQQGKKVLLQKNISLKNKNLDLKKQKQKLKKTVKRLGVATGIFAGTTAGTFIAGGVAKNNKNEKNVDVENIIKKFNDTNQNLNQSLTQDVTQSPVETCATEKNFTCLTPQNITVEIPEGTNIIIEDNPSHEIQEEINLSNETPTIICQAPPVKSCAPIESINANNCNLTTTTIFEAIDNNNLREVQCWLAKNSDAINNSTGETGRFQYPNALAYAIGKEKSDKIILELIKQKPDLIYSKLVGMPLLTWLFDEKFSQILEKVYDLTRFDVNYSHANTGSLAEIAVKASENSTDLLEFLKKYGVDFNWSGDTLLIIWAVVRNNSPAIKFLFENSTISRGYKFTGRYLPRRGGYVVVRQKPLLHLAFDSFSAKSCLALIPLVDFNATDENEVNIKDYVGNKVYIGMDECKRAILAHLKV